MILEQLSLANFRGFEQIDLTFDKRVTVIAGVNGIGKSGILKVIATLLSRTMPQFTPAPAGRDEQSFDDDDILYSKHSLQVTLEFVAHDVRMQAVGARRRLDPNRLAKLDERLKQVRKKLRGTSKSDDRRLRELKREEQTILTSQGEEGDQWNTLVVESFGDDTATQDPPTNRAAILKTLKDREPAPVAILFTPSRQLYERARTLATPEPFQPSAVYHLALTDRTLKLSEFLAWFHTMEKLPGQGKRARQQVLCHLQAVIQQFIPEFGKLRIEESPRLRFVVEKDGVPLGFEQLSDGERGLLAILFDITRRLAIANPHLDNPATEGTGVVLIDEAELHLHPKWQRQVLNRLTETFRNCQFIVTTHSPLLLGEVPAESVRFLYRDNEKIASWTPEYALGLDANRILEDYMDVKSRDPQTAKRITELFRAIDDEDFPSAQQRITALAESLGDDDPELVRARSLIAFLEGEE